MRRTERLNVMLRIFRALRAFDTSLDQLDDASASALRVGRTDLRALVLVSRHGRLGAGRVARALGLTSGAFTTLLDRMERRGLLRRVRDTQDRRRVMVYMTGEGRRCESDLFERFRREAARSLGRRSIRELERIEEFLLSARLVADQERSRIERRDPPLP